MTIEKKINKLEQLINNIKDTGPRGITHTPSGKPWREFQLHMAVHNVFGQYYRNAKTDKLVEYHNKVIEALRASSILEWHTVAEELCKMLDANANRSQMRKAKANKKTYTFHLTESEYRAVKQALAAERG